jgi:DNA-binding NtrC family response regulator
LAVLARWSAIPRLGVFAGDHCLSDPEIVFHCNEFALWPCPEGELDLRLKRLGATARKAASQPEPGSDDLLHLNLIGNSRPFRNVVGRLKRFARCDAPVLIEGETGTGKELAARAVHYLSHRHEHPFIPVNCGALPDTLLENELFGHAKGAFTDAREPYTGLVAQAENGTLFLDELESLTLRGQVALLRFLQEMEYRPLGSARTIRANVRVIAATNVSAEVLAADRGFRKDLLYRLNIMPVCLPPLRERADDVLLLAEHFLADLRRRYGQPERYLHVDFIDWMRGHNWPGNVRELENLLHRQFLLSDEATIRLSPTTVPAAGPPPSPGTSAGAFRAAKAQAIEVFEREYLSRLLTQAGGNVTLAAKRAGKERRAFGRLLKKHGIGGTKG